MSSPPDGIALVDTHCHIQVAWRTVAGDEQTAKLYEKAGNPQPDDSIKDAEAAGVRSMLCVGCALPDSQLAVEFVQDRPQCHATIGIHPHEAKDHAGDAAKLEAFAALASQPKVVGIGECGLDYYYTHSPKDQQAQILRFQLDLAQKHHLPLVFHVRDAFDDFWPIFDDYEGLRGVIHSFSAGEQDLQQILSRGLYVGLNGIMTFTKNPDQLAAAKAVPLDKLLLETDAPYLTPHPWRGTICEPKHVRATAQFLAELRGESLTTLAAATTANAQKLFGIHL